MTPAALPGTGAAMEQPRTSLWLVPAEPDRRPLQARIDALAADLGTPSFTPHVTLVSAVVGDAAVRTALAQVAARWEPVVVTAGPTAHGRERFKALYVKIDDGRISDLAADLAASLGVAFDPAALDPHLSLAYVEDLDLARGADLAARHTLLGAGWRFDTLAASRPDGPAGDVARWRTVATAPLGRAERQRR